GDVAVVVPVGGGERCQAVGDAGLVALRAVRAELPGREHLATHARLVRVDGAACPYADLGIQGDAARCGRPGAAHVDAVRVEPRGQSGRHGAAHHGFGLRPVEADAEVGAAGAAAQAGMVHGRKPVGPGGREDAGIGAAMLRFPRPRASLAIRIARGANGSGRCWRARLRPACASGDNGAMTAPCNIAAALPRLASESPDRIAMRCPGGRGPDGMARYDVTLTYGELDARSDAIAAGLAAHGVVRGTRTVVMVRPSPAFFLLMFALFKAGAVPVLVDPGIDKRALRQCLDEARPEAFVGIPLAHLARRLLGWARSASVRVTTG